MSASRQPAAASVATTSVLADLQLHVDGLEATVVADGRTIEVRCADVGRLLREALGASGAVARQRAVRRAAGQVATALDGAGLTARLVGADGPVVTLGRGTRSSLARVVTGSDHLALGAPFAVLRAVGSSGALPSRARVLLGSGVLTAVLVGGGLVHRVRSSRHGRA